jgi:hypothetical protein
MLWRRRLREDRSAPGSPPARRPMIEDDDLPPRLSSSDDPAAVHAIRARFLVILSGPGQFACL